MTSTDPIPEAFLDCARRLAPLTPVERRRVLAGLAGIYAAEFDALEPCKAEEKKT